MRTTTLSFGVVIGAFAEANDVDVGNLSPAEITPETMGENGAMMNDMTTANDVAISNRL